MLAPSAGESELDFTASKVSFERDPMSEKVAAALGGLATGLTFVFVLPALKRQGFGSLEIILLCGALGGLFSIAWRVIHLSLLRRRWK